MTSRLQNFIDGAFVDSAATEDIQIVNPADETVVAASPVSTAAEITAAVDVPLSVDVESGYAEAPTRLIEGLLSVGAVGLNIEDTVHSEGGRLREPAEHAEVRGLTSEFEQTLPEPEPESADGQTDQKQPGFASTLRRLLWGVNARSGD